MNGIPARPRLRPELRWISLDSDGVGDEVAASDSQLLDPALARRLGVSRAQRAVLELCDGGRALAGIAALVRGSGVDADEQLVVELVRSAAGLELLCADDPIEESRRFAERRAHRRAALDGAEADGLATTLAIARTIPLFAERGLEGDAISSTPTIGKSEVRAAFPDRLLPAGRDAGELYVRRTSGTSSDGVQSFRERAEDELQEERIWRLGAYAGGALGCRFTTRQCSGGACPLEAPTPGTPRHRVVDGMLWLDVPEDAWSLLPAQLDDIGNAIAHHRPTHIGADASYLACWVARQAERGATVARVRHVQTGFAFATGLHRAAIANAFACPIVDVYSSSELGLVAVECAAGRMHVLEPLFLPEVLELERDVPVAPGDVGELVITTLARQRAPLVRYRTGDLVRTASESCRCGAAELAVTMEGRRRDAIVGARGELLTTRAIDDVIGVDPSLLHYQLVELGPARLELRGLGDPVLAARRLTQSFDGAAEVRARRVERIAAEPSGKYRFTKPR